MAEVLMGKRFRRLARWAIGCGLAFSLLACAGPFYRPERTRYTYRLTMTHPVRANSLRYEDEFIAIRFEFYQTELAFHLRNKTNRLLRIFWDDSRYVSESGVAKRIFHKGVRLRNRFEPQPPTVIPARAGWEDFVIPGENVVEGLVWSGYIPLFPVWDYEADRYFLTGRTAADRSAERRRAIAASLDGATIGLDLALEVAEKRETYRFRFHVQVTRQ